MDAVKFNVDPSQRGPLFDTTGDGKIVFTTTVVVVDALLQPLDEVVTEYVPALAEVTLLIVGF